MLNRDSPEVTILKTYCSQVQNSPRMLEDQPHRREGVHIFCEDWEIIELLKCLFNGVDVYMKEDPPKRLKKNPLWSREDIIQKSRKLAEELKTPEAIVEHFKRLRGNNA